MVTFDLLDEGDDRSLVGDVDADADTPDLLCDRGGAVASRSATYTIGAPSAAKRRAMARPIPLAAPVTTTTAP